MLITGKGVGQGKIWREAQPHMRLPRQPTRRVRILRCASHASLQEECAAADAPPHASLQEERAASDAPSHASLKEECASSDAPSHASLQEERAASDAPSHASLQEDRAASDAPSHASLQEKRAAADAPSHASLQEECAASDAPPSHFAGQLPIRNDPLTAQIATLILAARPFLISEDQPNQRHLRAIPAVGACPVPFRPLLATCILIHYS